MAASFIKSLTGFVLSPFLSLASMLQYVLGFPQTPKVAAPDTVLECIDSGSGVLQVLAGGERSTQV